MYDHTFSKLANHQIRHQITHKVGCQPDDCMRPLQSSSGFVGMFYLLYHPQGYGINHGNNHRDNKITQTVLTSKAAHFPHTAQFLIWRGFRQNLPMSLLSASVASFIDTLILSPTKHVIGKMYNDYNVFWPKIILALCPYFVY